MTSDPEKLKGLALLLLHAVRVIRNGYKKRFCELVFKKIRNEKLVTHKNLRNAFLKTTSGKKFPKKRCKIKIKEK